MEVFETGMLLFWGPIVFIILALLTMFQFQVLFSAFASLAHRRKGNFLWHQVQPWLHRMSSFAEASFGPPHSFKPSPTHVLLVALIGAVLLAGERARGPARRRV